MPLLFRHDLWSSVWFYLLERESWRPYVRSEPAPHQQSVRPQMRRESTRAFKQISRLSEALTPFSRESLHAAWNEKVLESLGVSIPAILILQVKSADIEASHQRGPPYLVSAPWPCIEVITGPSMGLLERWYARGSARRFTKPSRSKNGAGNTRFPNCGFKQTRSVHTLYNTHISPYLSIDPLYIHSCMYTHIQKKSNRVR